MSNIAYNCQYSAKNLYALGMGAPFKTPRALFCRYRTHQNRFCRMVGMIFDPQNRSPRHFLSFRNKLKPLPQKPYVNEATQVNEEGDGSLPTPESSTKCSTADGVNPQM